MPLMSMMLGRPVPDADVEAPVVMELATAVAIVWAMDSMVPISAMRALSWTIVCASVAR